jgi:peptide deformylase
MSMKIVKYGDPVLERRAEDVTEFDDALRELVDAMFETMYEAHGVGLAAPQVGVSLRLFVMDCSSEERPAEKIVLANPEILEMLGSAGGAEGCLSVPGFYSDLVRPARVRVRGQLADGSWAEYEFEELEARCVAHECDHLAGTLFIERLGPVRRDLIRRKIRKLKKAGDW